MKIPRVRPLRALALALVILLPALLAPGARVAVRVTVDTAGPSTRVMLTASRPVSAAVTAARGKIEVLYSEPIEAEPSEGRTDDAILSGWSARGDRTLVLSTGPAYKGYETFHLKNPERLVVDLEGDRPVRGDAGRDRRSAGRTSFMVVIDPGHGGVETGAIGPSGLQEKDVSLDLARRLKAFLQEDATADVTLTRDEDRFVALDERTAIANHNRADLFLSIHLNSAKRRQAFGAETYFLSPDATDDEARTLAALENHAVSSGGKDAGLEMILWDLAQNQYLAESSRLAESVQTEMNQLAGTRNRGVRQAPFRVLMGATMPAILVEVGFISNPEEEARFQSPEHRDKVVEAIARAIRGFRREISE